LELTRNVTLGVYLPEKTWVHQLDPRSKIIFAVILITLIFFIDTYTAYAWFALFILGIQRISRVPLSFVLTGLRPMIPVLVIIWIFQFFFYEAADASTLVSFWVIEGTDAGLRMGNLIILRVLMLYLVITTLTLTTTLVNLTHGMEILIAPLRRVGVPSQELAMVMVIALRFVPTFAEELEKIIKAQMARGVAFDRGNFLRRAVSIFGAFLPLFVNAYKRGEELIVAMEARNYSGGRGRTRMKTLKMCRLDLAGAIVMLAFSLLLLILINLIPPPY